MKTKDLNTVIVSISDVQYYRSADIGHPFLGTPVVQKPTCMWHLAMVCFHVTSQMWNLAIMVTYIFPTSLAV